MIQAIERHLPLQTLILCLTELVLSFFIAYNLLSPEPSSLVLGKSPTHNALILALTVGATAVAIGLYRPEIFRHFYDVLINTALGGLLAFPAAWAVSHAAGMDMERLVGHDAFWPAKIVVLWIAALFGVRLLFLVAVRRNLLVKPVALLGPQVAITATAAAISRGHQGFFDVVSGSVANVGPAALRAAGVRQAIVPQSVLVGMLADERAEYAAEGVALETEARFWERRLKRVNIAHLNDAWTIGLGPVQASRVGNHLSRVADLGLSLVLLLLTLPLMLFVVCLVRLEGGGPILYRQERIGLGGKPFTLLKFRSMQTDAEMRGPTWAQQRDPRVTRVGAFIRRTRIDELPQLINVLQGTMSFIGPRPERPHFVEQLAKVIPYYEQRARVKPGLTGWAQVNFPYGASVDDARVKLSYDLYYVKYHGILLNTAILFSTIRVILCQEGAR